MLFRRHFLPSLLILQMTFGQFITVQSAHAQPQSDIVSELENSNENDLPEKSKDAFLLTKQKLTTYSKGETSYDLSALDLNLPEVAVTDLAKEVKLEIESDGSLSFVRVNGDQTIARHNLAQVKPLAMARDQELLIILDQSGAYRAIDMGYAKTALFRSPMPVIHLLDSKVDRLKLSHAQLNFLKREQTPFDATSEMDGVFPIDQNRVMRAGNLMVTIESAGSRHLLEELSRSVIRTQVYTAETLISFLAMRLVPDQFAIEISKLNELDQAAKQLTDVSTEVDPFVKAAIQAIPEDALLALEGRATSNLSRSDERVDQFSFQEWQSQYQTLSKKVSSEEAMSAAANSSKKRFSPRAMIYRYLTPKAMKTMALLTAGGAAAYGASQLLGENGPAWAVHLTNEVYENYIPAVLKDATYRATLLKSSIALTSFIPLIWGIGFLGSKKSAQGWKPIKMLAAMGMKVYAAIQLPFYHRLASMTKQDSFLKAMRLGLNPLQKIAAESPIGKQLQLKTDIFPAVNNPRWNSASGDQSALKAAATQALVQQKERSTTLSWMLAAMVVSEDAKVDPATIALLADQAGSGGLAMTEEAMAKYLESPEFRQKWQQVATELQRELNRLKDPALLTEIEKISPDELGRLYKTAKETQSKIQTRGKVAKSLAVLRGRWQTASSAIAQGFASFGIRENEFLRNAEPSDFVVDQFWRQFLVDYALAVGQMGLVGARADLHDPQALAANEHGPLWTNPGHFADMFGQVRIYGISVPSNMALTYQKAAEVIEGTYAPVEDQSLLGVQKSEGFFKGVAEWAKGTTNLTQADYGAYFVKKLVRNLKTIQAGFLLNTIERVAIGGQHVSDASMAFIYMTIWSTWQYGWLWEPVNRGNQMYGEKIDARSKALTEIKTALASAIRLDDPLQIAAQTEALKEIYDDSPVNLPSKLSGSIDEMFSLLENMDLTRIQALNLSVRQNRSQVDELRQAIVSGDLAQIKVARTQLMKNYQAAGAESESLGLMMKLNAVSLLEFALETPPYAVKAHAGVDWFTTLLGAVSTTYYATALSVDTFRENISWGEKIGETAILSAGLYAGTYYGPRLWTRWVRPAAKTLKEGVCNLLLSGQFRTID
jgi:hypothetical protein